MKKKKTIVMVGNMDSGCIVRKPGRREIYLWNGKCFAAKRVRITIEEI